MAATRSKIKATKERQMKATQTQKGQCFSSATRITDVLSSVPIVGRRGGEAVSRRRTVV